MTFLNGATTQDEVEKDKLFHYAYIQFKGYKLVFLSLSFKNVKQAGDVCKLPSNITPTNHITASSQAATEWSAPIYVYTDGRVSIRWIKDNATVNSLYYCRCTYLRKD